MEPRAGQERFLPEDTRVYYGLLDQGHTVVERKLMEGYRLVDVILTGGAPWGFTLKGGKEHGEPLIITKVEDGNKAADILMAGDEIVNINDQQLLGYRQEAICLVKGSHKILKMIVKRRNDISYRPHSWHSNKLIESAMDTVTPQMSNASPFWNARYRSSSSSHDLSNPWDQTSLQRNSGHFSSMGSMDSIDQTYQFGRLSSAKSNNSIDYVGSQNKRDSAYGSFSASFSTPDHTLSKTASASTENILYKNNEWDNTKLGYGKTSPSMNEVRRSADRQVLQSTSINETSKIQRTEDNTEPRYSGRSNFGPVWNIPDKKKTASPPPPPPPQRSDSYAVTKIHEKPTNLMHLDASSTQHFNVANRSQAKPDWSLEISEQQRPIRAHDRTVADTRRTSNSSYHAGLNADQGLSPYKDKYPSNLPNVSRIQASLSTNDVRFAQPAYNYHHQRQYSDESTLFQSTRTSAQHKSQQQPMKYESSVNQVPSDLTYVYHPHQFRAPATSAGFSSGKQNVENNGQNHFHVVSIKHPQGNTTHHQFKEEENYAPEVNSGRKSVQPENTVISIEIPAYSLPQESFEPSQINCEKNYLKISEKKDNYLGNNEQIINKTTGYSEEKCNDRFSQLDHSEKGSYRSSQDYSWRKEENKITPLVTPMLHSLAQEGRNRSESFPDTGNEKLSFPDAGKQSRRSDRFATTLRNEIQQRRARLQKSKSTAALTESNETETSDNWKQDSLESMSPTSEGSFSSTYRSHLQEAQARVLRATSFKRRDLDTGISDHLSLFQDRNMQISSFSGLSLDPVQPKKNTAVNSSQNVSRIGARKRFTTQQKLMSYSEPEKINEVGVEDQYNFRTENSTKRTVGSFADRWKFFEETSKCAQPKVPPKVVSSSQSEETSEIAINRDYAKSSEGQESKRALAVSGQNPADENGFPDKVTTERRQRLGTFAEYEASWKEQKTQLERKNSGRCHSADNILDADLEQNPKAQYIHERSKSSPTTDFYAQAAAVESKQQSESVRRDTENSNSTHCRSSTGDSPTRTVEAGDQCGATNEQEVLTCNTKWKPHDKSFPIPETSNESQQSRARSGTLPNDYRFAHENVNQGNRDISFSAVPISEACPDFSNADSDQLQDHPSVFKKRSAAPQRPPPPKLENKYWRQNGSSSSLATSSESLLTAQARRAQSYSPSSQDTFPPQSLQKQSPSTYPDKNPSIHIYDYQLSVPPENDRYHLEKKYFESELSSKSHLQIPGMEPSRSPSPQFAPQKLTDKPPLLVPEENLSRIERVIDNTTVKMVPIKIVHSETHAEKESRHNLLSAIEPTALPTGLAKDQLKTLSTSEQSYSRFCAYTRQESREEEESRVTDLYSCQRNAEDDNENDVSSLAPSNAKSKDAIYADLKSEELVREIVDKDKSLADILDPNAKMRTTMDLMEGIFPKDEHLLEEAQQRRKHLPKIPSPRSTDDKKDEQNVPSAVSLTTSSTYYSTSAAKAELLIKMKDMQEQQHIAENSEDELGQNLSEKKQELIDSISKKLQVLRDAKETLLEDVQCNNALGEEVEIIVKEVCKPNEFDKFRMFIGDLEKIVNLLLSLSGRLARVENALNNLDETVSPEERKTLLEKRKLLTRQHEDAKELKENLDRRERTVYEILANYLNEENLADYEHFVKMKSALILEQRELEDKIKLGEEQLKCLTDSLPLDRIK
ncbi:hypothetical protein XENTR_v10005487 [Xenopus tropicalis]|uniref:Protein Shroom2 n=1 Tax=Xenopus tropicalis TaxID=8364 RepID=A0A6I8Q0I6_XENTR|nr:hypothetical protein XENTR_v10005487 [Xenopus tropicalis]